MTSSRPYLIRALYSWIIDNGMTPHLLVDATRDEVEVPAEFIDNGKIVLNVSPRAVRSLDIGNDCIEFGGRFQGAPLDVVVPVGSVLAVYARENGRGMLFDRDDDAAGDGDDDQPPSGGGSRRPNLRVVK